MKKIILIFLLFLGVASTNKAQVLFNTAQTLNKGNFSLGLDGTFGDYWNNNFGLFIDGGYGLGNNSDLGLKLGLGWGETYFGLDYEKTIASGKPYFSLHGGAHYWYNFGLDFGATVSFPVGGNLFITTGLDLDLNFGHGPYDDLNLYAPLWLPLNLEVYIQKNLSIVFEGNIKLTSPAFTTVGGGVNIYF